MAYCIFTHSERVENRCENNCGASLELCIAISGPQFNKSVQVDEVTDNYCHFCSVAMPEETSEIAEQKLYAVLEKNHITLKPFERVCSGKIRIYFCDSVHLENLGLPNGIRGDDAPVDIRRVLTQGLFGYFHFLNPQVVFDKGITVQGDGWLYSETFFPCQKRFDNH